jgi:hypothetical protein
MTAQIYVHPCGAKNTVFAIDAKDKPMLWYSEKTSNRMKNVAVPKLYITVSLQQGIGYYVGLVILLRRI